MPAVFFVLNYLFDQSQRYGVPVIFTFTGCNTGQNAEDQIAYDCCEPEENSNDHDHKDRWGNHGKDDSDLEVERFLALFIYKLVFIFFDQP